MEEEIEGRKRNSERKGRYINTRKIKRKRRRKRRGREDMYMKETCRG